jgi:hypothetical protein
MLLAAAVFHGHRGGQVRPGQEVHGPVRVVPTSSRGRATVVAKQEGGRPASRRSAPSPRFTGGGQRGLPGIVEKIHFDSGKTVREGHPGRAGHRQERAQLEAAQAQQKLARLNFERFRGSATRASSPRRTSTAPGPRTRRETPGSARSAPRSRARRSARRSPGSLGSARSTWASTWREARRSSRSSRWTRST